MMEAHMQGDTGITLYSDHLPAHLRYPELNLSHLLRHDGWLLTPSGHLGRTYANGVTALIMPGPRGFEYALADSQGFVMLRPSGRYATLKEAVEAVEGHLRERHLI
jgi:hypothetical protein